MTTFLRNNYEKVLLAAALLALGMGAVWGWPARPEGTLEQPAVKAVPNDFIGRITAPPGEACAPAVWDEPAIQSGGAGWVYELFAPPEIYYDSKAKSFSVLPPRDRNLTPERSTQEEFGIELEEVQREPYRLQLAGYLGPPADCTGVFVDSDSNETFLARPGRRFAELGLRLKELTVMRVDGGRRDSRAGCELTVAAIMEDEWAGAEVRLESRGRALTDNPLAVLRLGRVRAALQEGETLLGDEGEYRVERIQLDPPEVEIARLTAGQAAPEIHVLHPTAPESKRAKRSTALGGTRSLPPAAGPVSTDSAE